MITRPVDDIQEIVACARRIGQSDTLRAIRYLTDTYTTGCIDMHTFAQTVADILEAEQRARANVAGRFGSGMMAE